MKMIVLPLIPVIVKVFAVSSIVQVITEVLKPDPAWQVPADPE